MRYRVPERLNRNTRNLILEVAEKGRSIPGFISLAMGNPAEEAIPVELTETETAVVARHSGTEYQVPLSDIESAELLTERLASSRVAVRCFMNATANMRNVGAAAVGIPGDDQGMIPEALEERARSGKGKYIYLIPNFHNPMGITIPLQRRKDLYTVACKYDLVIYEDDPYGDIRFAGQPVPTFKSLDTDNRVVYAGSFSKTLSAGLRAGYLYAPEGLAGHLAAVKTAE